MSDEAQAKGDLAALMAKLENGPPSSPVDENQFRSPKPLYLLSVEDPDEKAIALIVRTSGDGIQRATIVLPKWHELPAGWDGPHDMATALRLADDYAHHYGYHAIIIDIESSQLWQPEWGPLDLGGSFEE